MGEVVLASTTSSQEELDHAASDNWREPFVPRPAETKAEEELAPAEKTEDQKPPKTEHKSGWQKRIDKLTARNHQLETRLQEVEAKIKPAEEKPLEAPKEPKLADYGNDVEKWTAARDAWKKNEEIRIETEATQKATFEAYNKKISDARGQYDDWDEVVSGADKVNIPQAAYNAIVESENGPDVAYYLATHTEEAVALNEMSAISAIRAVGKISDSLIAAKGKTVVKEKVKPPAPVTPVGGSATRSAVALDELSPREYIRVRNKQERENRGR